jgi:hypothetical protein
MPDIQPRQLTLEPEGLAFKLTRIDERGQTTSILLSEDEVMALALSAERMRDYIAERYVKA